MPRPKFTPTYCVHKRSGRAFVTIDGRQIPVGVANSQESRDAYDRIIGQWFSNGVCVMRARDVDRPVTPWVYRPMFHKTQAWHRPRGADRPAGP
jgi:hypothetical protein